MFDIHFWIRAILCANEVAPWCRQEDSDEIEGAGGIHAFKP